MTPSSHSSTLEQERAQDIALCGELKNALERVAELMTATKNVGIIASFRFDKRMNNNIEEFFLAQFDVSKILRPEPTQ